ncbi:hypothetical protein [Paenibacillus sp. URB8-2]|uniref:hypothetical protein n=1 Tax=Paenibacillus sp. URB8-2 TaxID=2741301 RepID=UPI0015BFAED8|nr:hypothetical protein [Paenibacillus sp. URB8-2]BCG60380.1 hypothetical protein PUR_38050 [Paenibacillus sp. URB8-2]
MNQEQKPYISKKDIRLVYKWHSEKVDQLIKDGHLERIDTSNGPRISRESIEKYYLFEQNILENYISPKAVILHLFGYQKPHTNIVETLEKKGYIDSVVLDYPINRYRKWVSKRSISTLFQKLEEDFISFEEAREQLSLPSSKLYLKIRLVP